jgi:uncharacterized membrane protein YkoI
MKSLMAFVIVVAGVGSAMAADKKIARKDLPAAVQKAVQLEEAKGAVVKTIIAENEGGTTVYEIETMVSGHARDLIFDKTGTLTEVEEAIAIDAVPAPARAALEGAGTVMKVETLTKGARVLYEAQVEKNGKKSEVTVDATGKRIKN